MTLSILDNQFITKYNPYILNRDANKKIVDKEGVIEQLNILNLHGISTPVSTQYNQANSINYKMVYLIPVFQQKILGVFRHTRQSTDNWINSSIVNISKKTYFTKVSSFNSIREEKKVKSIAIRAVYALNLDYALVKIGVGAGSKPSVLFVNAFPESSEKLLDIFDKAIENFTEKWDKFIKNNNQSVILGADPEFILQGPSGNLVLASNYLPKKGTAGCDQIWINRDRTQLPLAELRPNPSDEPKQLLINLYKSMLLANRKIQNKQIKWLAGAMPITGYPIGGHIHFSNIWLNSFLLRALDNYLTLSISMLEEKQRGLARRPKYGFLGDYREQYHGGFEYRTPPSWLISPTITKGTIALAKLIAENYHYLYQNPLADVPIQKAYYTGDKEILRPVVKELWSELKQLRDFKLYENYLYALEDLINRGFSWNEKTDIKIAWLLSSNQSRKG